MTITQAVDIPVGHRLVIDVPRELPVGPAILTFTPAGDDTEHLAASPANRERVDRAIGNIERGERLVSFDSLEQLDHVVVVSCKYHYN